MEEYMTMRDIGSEVGLTSHQVGRQLKELGLRTEAGKPSLTAFHNDLVEQRWARDGRGYCWAWHRKRVLPLLNVAKPAHDQQNCERSGTSDPSE